MEREDKLMNTQKTDLNEVAKDIERIAKKTITKNLSDSQIVLHNVATTDRVAELEEKVDALTEVVFDLIKILRKKEEE